MTEPIKDTQPAIGILCLDEPPYKMPEQGGLYDAAHFPWKIIRETVPGASVDAILSAAPNLATPFIDAAKKLEQQGAGIVISNCGYTIAYDSLIGSRLSVPVATSSLLLLPLLANLLKDFEKIGVLTFDAEKLSPDHLSAAWPAINTNAVKLSGLEHTDSWQQIVAHGRYEWSQLETDSTTVLDRLIESTPGLKFIIVECCALCSFLPVYRVHSPVAVFDIVSLANLLIDGFPVPVPPG